MDLTLNCITYGLFWLIFWFAVEAKEEDQVDCWFWERKSMQKFMLRFIFWIAYA